MITHILQKDILRALSLADGLRFSQLKPASIESNLFMYHLRQVMKAGLVTKNGQQYALTGDGQRYIASVTRSQLEFRQQPRLFCLLVLTNTNGEVVLYRRPRQPYMRRYTFPGDVIYFNQTIEELKYPLLYDRVGLETDLKLRGLVDTRLVQDSQVVTHIYAQLLWGRVLGRPKLTSIDSRFVPEWINLDELNPSQVLPDVPIIMQKLAESDQYFYLDLLNEL